MSRTTIHLLCVCVFWCSINKPPEGMATDNEFILLTSAALLCGAAADNEETAQLVYPAR